MISTNPASQRALILQQQRRYADAEREWRGAIAQEPGEAGPHAMLALCLAERGALDEATREAQQAVGLGPDNAFAHYVLGHVWYKRDRYVEAERSAREAIRLDPYDADQFALLAAIFHDQKRWQDCLSAAEQGLAVDPEHAGCVNLRAMALVRLGRRDEAGQAIGAALARDPDNAVTHANQGWALLHAGQPKEALTHFRESLRLDPESDWARAGIVEALKARNPLYRWILRYFLFMSGLSDRAQWGVIIGGYVAYRLLRGVAQSNPEARPFVVPLIALYVVFCLLTWLADPLFNLMLRLNRFGRLALSRDQVVASNWVGGALLGVIACVAAALVWPGTLTVGGAAFFGLMLIPLAAVFSCDRGWPRTTMGAISAGLAVLGAGALAIVAAAGEPGFAEPPAAALLLGILFLLGAGLSRWVGNALIMAKVRK